MGLFKRIGKKVRKIGHRAINTISVGARKVSNTAKKIKPYLEKAGEIAEMVGVATGQPEILALGEGLAEGAQVAGVVSQVADKTRSGIEKVRKMDTAKDGVEELLGARDDAYGIFN